MARSLLVLSLAALFAATTAWAEPSPAPSPSASPSPEPSPRKEWKGPKDRGPKDKDRVPDWDKDRGPKDKGWKSDRDQDRRFDRDKDRDWDNEKFRDRGDRRPGPDDDGPMARFKARLEKMTPEERQHFQDNWKRWKEMAPREKQDWQGRAQEMRDRMKKAVDDTISKLGLELDKDQKEVFALRYMQERRKIEEQLRKEMDAKRTTEVDAMLQRLKTEFEPKSSPTPAVTPESSATP